MYIFYFIISSDSVVTEQLPFFSRRVRSYETNCEHIAKEYCNNIGKNFQFLLAPIPLLTFVL